MVSGLATPITNTSTPSNESSPMNATATMSTNKSDTISETSPSSNTTANNGGNGEKPLGLLARAAIMKRQMDIAEKDIEQQQQQTSSSSSDNSGSDEKTIKVEPEITVEPKKAKKSSTTNNEKSLSTIQTVAATHNRQFTLKQVSKFSDKRLLSTFVEYKRDVKTKRCSYSCQLLPQQCQQRFESVFGSAEAEQSKKDIVDHLRQHLCNLEQTMPNLRLNSCRKIRKSTVDNKKATTAKSIKKESEDVCATISVPSTTTTTTKTVAIENDILKQSIANAEIEEEIYGLMNVENHHQRELNQQQQQQPGLQVHHILNTSLPISTFVVATPAMAGQPSLMTHHTMED
ncbi:zinc finger domain-containing protein, partial [Euroglyphus maynei]